MGGLWEQLWVSRSPLEGYGFVLGLAGIEFMEFLVLCLGLVWEQR